MRVVLLAAGLLCACKATGTFKCMTSDECRLGDEIGYCEDSGYCTFNDTACDSQRRYDETAEFPLAGECLSGFVTGHTSERYIVNDEAGLPSVQTLIPAMLAIEVELDDGSKPAVRVDHDGTWSFPAPAGAHYTLREPVFGELQLSAPHVELASFSASRPKPARATKATQIKFMYNSASLGSMWVASTGVFTETLTTITATNFTFDWFTAKTQTSDKPGLLDKDAHDRLYVNQTANIGGYVSIVASATEQLTIADGATVNGASQLTSTMRDQCVQLKTASVAEQSRMKSTEPSLTNMGTEWTVTAAQARDITTEGSFTLAHFEQTTMVNDANLNVTFSNPFPGTKALAFTSVSGNFTEPGGGFTLPLDMWSESYAPIDPVAGSCAATVSFGGPTAIGGALVVGGTAVDANDKLVTTDVAARVPLAWSQVVSGVASYWWVGIYEASDDGAGGLVFGNIYWIATPDTHALLPAGLLKSGHTYVARFLAEQGTPNSGQGDFVTLAYPVAETGSWSKSFKIK